MERLACTSGLERRQESRPQIASVKFERRDRLLFVTERFPKIAGELQIADLSAPTTQELGRKTLRGAFRERFQLLLAREFPQWRVEEVAVEANLEHSLPASYARAFLRSGSRGTAAIAVPQDAPDPAAIVAFGLVWLDYLRRREKALLIRTLLLYLPLKTERHAGLRAAWINPAFVQCRLFAYDALDRCGAIDFADCGNLESTLPACRRPRQPNGQNLVIAGIPGDVVQIEQSDGSVNLQIRGLAFGRMSGDKLSCGPTRRTRSTSAAAFAMAREVARRRTADAEDRQHPFYSANPEGWLESQVRENLEAIDASLLSVPLYGQVPVFGGGDRDVIDLLAVDNTGRLVVIELKTTADLQLPFQALDYWLRVRKHLNAGDFTRLGYFAGQVIRAEAPRILLVAPALEFHSTTEVLLDALSPAIEITR